MSVLGEWVEGDNGYGIIVKIIPEFYEYWESDMPEDKSAGDFKQNTVVLKKFCNFDFKVSLQTRLLSDRLISSIKDEDMSKIKKMLRDERVLKRFENYRIHDKQVEVTNIYLALSESEIKDIREQINCLENNGELNFIMEEVEAYLNELGISNVFGNPGLPNCYIQLTTAGLGVYRDNKLIFNEISLQDYEF